ncbi:MAG TPA: hypothetical protein VFK72_00085 [Nevskia sp.]|nr:hypothetical protein [Nevskia sp.]
MAFYGRHYWIEYTVWVVLFFGTIIATKLLLRGVPDGSLWRYAAVVLPTALALGACWLEFRNLRRIDELQRARYFESLLYGVAASMAYVIAVTLLEGFAGMPRAAPVGVLIANAVGCGYGLLVSWWRYR